MQNTAVFNGYVTLSLTEKSLYQSAALVAAFFYLECLSDRSATEQIISGHTPGARSTVEPYRSKGFNTVISLLSLSSMSLHVEFCTLDLPTFLTLRTQ